MAEAVLMPKTGITVESCIIEEWKKQVGDQVKLDEILFTYETDKAVFECPSTAEGELLEIYYQDGDEVPCLETVCAVGQKGDDCSAIRPSGVAAQAPAAVPATAEPAAPTAAAKAATAPTGETSVALASPRAKNLAAQAGVDWRKAVPTGSKGLIVERDVRKLMEEQSAATAATPAPVTQAPAAASAPAEAAADYTDSKFSVIRRTIARSMKESLGSSAQLTHNFAFDATAIKQYRAEMKALGGAYAGVTIGDMILYVVSRTLLAHPDLNAHMLDDEHIRHFNTVHLGVAVDTPRGLLVPVIRNAEKKSLLQISAELKKLAAEARTGAISPDKLNGASFTVSNLGSFGVRSFTPVINPPQTGIIGVCEIVEAPRTGKNGIELYPEMTLSLTYDHRAIDGAPASRFMQEVCKKLEYFTATLAE